MRNKTINIAIGCCAVFFCAASAYGQGWPDTCAHLKQWQYGQPQDEAQYKLQYDTLRLYVEKCAATDCTVASAFGTLDGAMQFMSNDSTRFEQYRAWLISVLYLNKTCEDYFCSDIDAIVTTFTYSKYGPLAHLAVLNYLRQYHRNCWNSADDKGYARDSATAFHYGYDPNHLPPLDSLGLGFLIKSGVATPTTPLTSQYLASFSSSPNPFRKETTLEFTLNRMSYVTLAVYDDLGRLVWGDGKGSSLEAGTHAIHLDVSSLPSGTLYARIATGFGEVKTVKLVHEK